MGNAGVSSFLSANPTLSALAGQATSFLGNGASSRGASASASSSGNSGSVDSHDTNGAGVKSISKGVALLGGVIGAAMLVM